MEGFHVQSAVAVAGEVGSLSLSLWVFVALIVLIKLDACTKIVFTKLQVPTLLNCLKAS